MEQAIEILKILASKLGQTVEYLWPEYVRYLAWSAVGDVIAAVFIFAAAATLLLKAINYPDKDSEGRLFAIVAGSIATTITTIVMAITLSSSIATIASPVGKAVDQIISSKK